MINSAEKYVCECGREFTSSSSYGGHKSHCRVHLGDEKFIEYQLLFDASLKRGRESQRLQREVKKKEQLDVWIKEGHLCEYCGKLMTEKWGSGRFCSQLCAATFSGKTLIKDNPILRAACLNCGNAVKTSKAKFCCPQCVNEYKSKQHYAKYKEDNSIAWGIQNMQKYKKYFLEEQNHRCAVCGCIDEWCGKSLMFILDHIDGNADNNNRDNLRLVCPNCDSQLDTFKSKNKISARAKYRNIKIVDKEEYEELIAKKETEEIIV